MHFLKLFLAGSFAAAASLRAILAVAIEALGASAAAVSGFLAGPAGMIIEMLISLAIGAMLALRVSSTRKTKSAKSS